MSKPRLEGKVAIITGAASGIGEAAAKLFAENGAFVVIADIQDELGHQVVASIGPEKSSYFHCDVRDERQVEETVAYTIQKYGTLDILFSNAAITGPIGSILEMDLDGFDDTIAINFRGPASTIKHAARAMVEKQVRGSIICTGSVASTLGGSGPPAYTASKHAVLGLVRSAADDLGQYGIRVNCVSPFGVATRMSTGMYNVDASTVEAAASSMSQLKGIILKPRHVAEAALFLASDESAYVTGHNLAVDGGVSVLSTTRLDRLEGKVALVTGAASGIGEEAVRLFAKNGAFVVVADVQDELGHQVISSIGSEKVSYRHCDVRDEKQVEETVAYTLDKYGSLDVLFSNAGIIGPLTGILELDLQGFDNTMATNVRGVAATIKHAARAMVARSIRGSIICTTSVAASLGGAGPHAYTTSKHALIGLVRAACSELGAYGIRVNCVSPFGIATPLSCRAYNLEPSEVEANCLALSNLKGIVLKARHIAEAAVFLASDESAYISGHNLAIDGGFTVVNHSFSAF
ncbi:hypothetical protein PVL29_008802 [Vitis rotundifolia]|uniref:Short-chain dehydrogenase reductase 3b-like n=1 Tax=Vitis rotundifolia TaxID=103349 RepID=A0AA38ZXB7_VITRO|nr:hypothetical protein PVL29_008802 [Vitis rotundifolia]